MATAVVEVAFLRYQPDAEPTDSICNLLSRRGDNEGDKQCDQAMQMHVVLNLPGTYALVFNTEQGGFGWNSRN